MRVAVVAPIMVRHDAISLSARDAVRSLAADPRFEVQHLGCVCDFPDIVHRPCGDIADLLLDPFYQTADAAIFHFGIHHSLFDALLAGGPPVRVVRFHNVTPMRFVAPAEMPVIERSLRQIEILRNADEIWADSPTNERDLLDRGFDPSRIRVIPLVVEDPDVATLAGKPAAPVRALYIGRIAASKGLHDLILAAARTGLPHGVLQVTIAGNTAWSDPGYLRKLHDLIASHELARVVHFVGTVDDSDRERLLHDAHILVVPSYHEGFCRPVAEGLRAGCVPLVYDAYNLPRIAGGTRARNAYRRYRPPGGRAGQPHPGAATRTRKARRTAAIARSRPNIDHRILLAGASACCRVRVRRGERGDPRAIAATCRQR